MTATAPMRARPCAPQDPTSVVGRMSTILGVFDPEHPELSLGDLVARSGLPKSTVYRMAEKLVDHGWLDRVSRRYRLGIRIFELSGLVYERQVLREIALPFMEDLFMSTKEVVHLGALHGHEVLYLDKISGHNGVRVATRVGGRQPLYCTALGKAILAHAPPSVVEVVLAHGLRPKTPYTIVIPDLLLEELALIRKRKIAYDREESGLAWSCAAAPILVRGKLSGAVSVTGSTARVDLERLGQAVKRAAEGIGRGLAEVVG